MSKSLPSDNIQNLGLSPRVHHILSRHGIDRVSKIMEVSDDYLFQLQGIGPTAIAEIRAKTRTFQAEWHSKFSSLQSAGDTAQRTATISPDPHLYNVPLEVLHLSTRTYNALVRNGCATLGHVMLVLQQFHATGVTLLRNLGKESVAELEQTYNAYLAEHPIELPSVTASATVPVEPQTTSKNDLQEGWQNLLRVVVAEISDDRLHGKAILEGHTLADWLKMDTSSEDGASISYNCQWLARALVAETVCDEFVRLFAGISASEIESFFCRMGPKKCTLDEIGRDRKVTRERVRQIVRKVKHQINGRLSTGPYIRLQSALRIAEEMGSAITYSAWVRRITSSGLLGNWSMGVAGNIHPKMSSVDLMFAVCNPEKSADIPKHLQMPENLRLVVNHKNLSASAVKAIAQLPKETVRTVRKQAKNGGAVHVPSVTKDLGLTVDETRSVLSELGYKQISNDWYMLRPRKSGKGADRLWAVFHTVLKMLQFCGPLEVKEVCSGLRKHVSRQGYAVPPIPIMLQVLTAYGFKLQDGRISWPCENLSTTSTSETIILRELDRLGPVVSHFELLQAFAQAGLSVPALYVTLRYSPLFAKADMGLYKLRGKVITQGDIQNTKERQTVTVADPEIQFDPTGVICFRLNLGSMAIAGGAMYTAHIPNLTGKWACCADSLACGTVSVRDNQIWGLAKSFRTIKACVGDRVELKFDTWQRTVTVTKVSDGSQ